MTKKEKPRRCNVGAKENESLEEVIDPIERQESMINRKKIYRTSACE